MSARGVQVAVRWSVGWALATIVLSVIMAQVAEARGTDISLIELVVPSATYAATWIVLLLPLVFAARTVALRWRTPFAAVARPLLALLATPVQLSLYFVVMGLLPMPTLPATAWPEGGAVFYFGRFYEGLAVALTVLVADGLIVRSRAEHARELREARLASQLAEARLNALGMELQPHFLFNTLNAISSLVHSDPDAADRMIARLSTLLRRTLDAGREPLSSLDDELSLLELYLDIQRVRFGERLRVSIDVTDDVRSAQVPRLLLQPLVENAMQHGLAPKLGMIALDVRAERVGDMLRVDVRDDGVGLSPTMREGTGLSNTRSRLLQLYADRHLLDLRSEPAGGTHVRLDIPFSDG